MTTNRRRERVYTQAAKLPSVTELPKLSEQKSDTQMALVDHVQRLEAIQGMDEHTRQQQEKLYAIEESFSPAKYRVNTLLATGMSAKDVAEELSCSITNVHALKDHTYQSLQAQVSLAHVGASKLQRQAWIRYVIENSLNPDDAK